MTASASNLSPSVRAELAHWRWRFLAAGVIALIVAALGAAASPARFLQAYLPPWIFFLGLALGSLGLLMIYQLTGGAWGFLIRRILEAAARTLPLVAVLFLPIALGVDRLYPWAAVQAGAAASAGSTNLARTAGDISPKILRHYLNPRDFWVRSAACLIAWSLVAAALDRLARRQEITGRGRLVPWLRTLSGIGLLSYGVGMNFAAVDWVMSLQAPFHSTIFGPLMASGQLLSALALAIHGLAHLSQQPPLERALSPPAVNDLGSLLFALLVVWGYMVWFQFMLIWMANLPTDVMWYAARSSAAWRTLAYLLLAFAFVIPLFVLLVRRTKRNLASLAPITGLIVLMQLVYDFYLVLPAFPAETILDRWMCFVTPIGLGGIWFAAFLWQLDRRTLLPHSDFNQNEALLLRDRYLRQLEHKPVLSAHH